MDWYHLIPRLDKGMLNLMIRGAEKHYTPSLRVQTGRDVPWWRGTSELRLELPSYGNESLFVAFHVFCWVCWMNGDRINGLQLTDPHQWVKNLGVKEPTDPHLVAPLMEVVYQPTGWFTLPKTKGFSEKWWDFGVEEFPATQSGIF